MPDERQRKIIHVDMDAFYASVEQRDNPDLLGKPIAVGGGSRRGVTTTASYEARAYGVRSAMPGYIARQKCPHIIFVPPRFEAYRAVSHEIRTIFLSYTDLVEPLSLDEAFLDVSKNKMDIDFATEVAKRIQADVLSATDLTCSVGVSYCKFLAKIASDYKKPNGITVIKPHKAIAFIQSLPIEKFFGIGKVTAARMHDLGIQTGHDLKQKDKLFLTQHFGKSGLFFYDMVRGIDERPVKPQRKRKSLAVERTLAESTDDLDVLRAQLEMIIDKLFLRASKSNFFGRTLTLKVKSADFKISTRSLSEPRVIQSRSDIGDTAHRLFDDHIVDFGLIRLIGLIISNAPDVDGNVIQAEFPF